MRVLLIEDDEADVFLVDEILARTLHEGLPPFKIQSAATLAEGLSRLRDDPPDLVLLDLMLPDSRGMETLKKTVAAAGTVPVIVMSGMDDQLLALESARHGAQDFILKGHVEAMWLSRSLRFALVRRPPGTFARESAEAVKS